MEDNLARKIKHLRIKLGVSQVGLSALLNVGVASVRRWESGKTIPLPNHLEKINQLNKEGINEIRKH